MKLTAFLEGAALGALAIYFADPNQGGRRRAQVRDQFFKQVHGKRDALDVMVRDLNHRARGMGYRMKTRFDHRVADDDVLVDRTRAELGRATTHPGAIRVESHDGVITLTGDALATEVQAIVRHVRRISGVKSVDNQLLVHDSPEGVSCLQGVGKLPANTRWTPAACLLMGGAGLMLNLYGMARGGIRGGAFQLGGLAMVARAFHDTEHRFDPAGERRPVQTAGERQNMPTDNAAAAM